MGWVQVLVPAVGVVAAVAAPNAAAALVLGVALGLTVGNPWPQASRRLAQRLLPATVVGLGAGMSLGPVLTAGATSVGSTALSLVATVLAGTLLSRALAVEATTAVLITVGTAICGGSAIAAVAPVVGARDEQITVSLATIFLLNGLALVVFPPLGHWAGLDGPTFGLWAAMAIQDTSSVVGAAMQVGADALAVAAPAKLARALWIVPVTIGIASVRGSRGEVKKPWFIAGFLAAAATVTYLPQLQPVGEVVAFIAKRGMVLTLFLIGLGVNVQSLRAVGWRPLAFGFVLWILLAGGTLGVLRAGGG